MAKYNGWTNKETWLVSLWYMDEIRTYRPSNADQIEEYIEDMIISDRHHNGLCLADTNWREIYEHIEET
jgi:hypothetical protein